MAAENLVEKVKTKTLRYDDGTEIETRTVFDAGGKELGKFMRKVQNKASKKSSSDRVLVEKVTSIKRSYDNGSSYCESKSFISDENGDLVLSEEIAVTEKAL